MTERHAAAFSPAGISSFFEICDRNPDGSRIRDISKVGSRGGGFILQRGVKTKVKVEPSDENRVSTYINGETTKAITSETTALELLKRVEGKFDVEVSHQIEVPIGSGFGTSAAGAFSCGLALAEAFSLPMTYNEIATIAHKADILSGTGLGTVEGLAVGGLVLIVEPGAPGIGATEQIPVSPDLRIVAGSFQPIKKSTVILSEERREVINRLGKETMRKILLNPNTENFMKCCKEFAAESGLMSERIRDLIVEAEKAGALGATQNMIGEAAHAAVHKDKLVSVRRAFEEYLPPESIIVSEIDFQGARTLS